MPSQKRTDHGGERTWIWLHSRLQAALNGYVAQHGGTKTQAIRHILEGYFGLTQQEKD